MEQGKVVTQSLVGQPSVGLNDGFRELLKFRPGSELPKAWIRDIVSDATQDIFLMVLWFLQESVALARNITCQLFWRRTFLQGAMQNPAAPHQVGCTLLALAASMPLLVQVRFWPHIRFPFALFFLFNIPPGSTALPAGLLLPLDCSRSTCVGSFLTAALPTW